MKTSKSALLAIATAGVFATAMAIAQDTPVPSANPSNTVPAVKCYGANSCKGKSQCQTSANSCSGKNSCKGAGLLMMNDQQECISKGGNLTEPTKLTTQSATQPYGQQ